MHTLTALPLEILDSIAYQLATCEPLGPPSLVVPLLLTCSRFNAALSPTTNTYLYARIFRHKFDTRAIERRAFTPTHTQCVEQLMHYCRALQVLRAGDVFVAALTSEADGFDRNAGEALLTAFVMMLEDDGKNARQLVEWAHADVFAERFVRRRLYEAREMNDGWPIENGPNACALWVLWMLTSEENLRKETPAQREQMIKLLLPFVFVPLRYPTAEAPPHFYHLPLPSASLPILPNTFNSPHGPYPTYAAPRITSQVHFATRPILSYPLAAPAAKLLFFARRELSPLPVPPHLALTRVHAHAAGNFEIGATVEDLRELNWSWTARLPMGAGLSSPTPTPAPIGATTSPTTLPTPSTIIAPIPTPTVSTPHTTTSAAWDTLPWAGKAPHSNHKQKSRGWDADWWRLRLCGDPQRANPRVRLGRVYEPGCMDGLWVGRMIITEASLSRFVMDNPAHPAAGVLTDDAPMTQQAAVYMRLREAHAVSGDPPLPTTCAHTRSSRTDKGTRRSTDMGMGAGPSVLPTGAGTGPAFDEGMANAWFPGETGSVRVDEVGDVRVGLGRGATGRGRGGAKRVVVSTLAGRGVYRCWEGRGKCDKEEREWEGYPHEPSTCEGCKARTELVERLRVKEREEREEQEREEREREALFAGVGLGLDEVPPDYDHDPDYDIDSDPDYEPEYQADDTDSSTTDSDPEEEEDEDEWDPPGETEEYTNIGPDGSERVYAALPRAHCRRKVLPCDGVREIVLYGETDERHGQAWNGYRFYGRVRPWDGLVGIVRVPSDLRNGYLFFYGYLVGGENFVGNWRITSADPTGPVWECAFAMSRREE